MERNQYYHFLVYLLGFSLSLGSVWAQDRDEDSPYSFSADTALVSKYIWRGQRLTNDWSFQPSGTFSLGGFSVNVWGTMDLAAVNEGDALFIRENPEASSGLNNDGLQGKFSEIDYTFSYNTAMEGVDLDFGTIVYTFPERGASLPTTVELYGGVSFAEVPLAPSATLYVDVDETGAGDGSNGVYFLLGVGHSFGFDHPNFKGLDLSTSISFANSGFCRYYYGASESGAHDFSFSVSAPIALGEHWSAGAFVTYSALLGDFRDHQYLDPRDVYRGTAGTPFSFADTVWGGVTLSVAF